MPDHRQGAAARDFPCAAALCLYIKEIAADIRSVEIWGTDL